MTWEKGGPNKNIGFSEQIKTTVSRSCTWFLTLSVASYVSFCHGNLTDPALMFQYVFLCIASSAGRTRYNHHDWHKSHCLSRYIYTCWKRATASHSRNESFCTSHPSHHGYGRMSSRALTTNVEENTLLQESTSKQYPSLISAQ